MLNSKLKNLKEEIHSFEKELLKKIESDLENLNVEVNVIELKRGHGVPKNIKSYEVHYLNKCLILNGTNKGIIFRVKSKSCYEVEISEEFYTKLSLLAKKRQCISKMENKLDSLKNLLLEEMNKGNI